MTMTIDTEQAPPSENEAPQRQYWTADQTWCSARSIPPDYVFEEMPESDHPTTSARSATRVYLYVEVGLGNDELWTGTSSSGRRYTYVTSRAHLTSHPGPSSEDAVLIDAARDVEQMDEATLRQTLIDERARWTRSYRALHNYADQNGYCGTFDQIMEQNGWPRRPKKYTITLNARRTFEMNERWIKSVLGSKYSVELPKRAKARIGETFTVNVTTPRALTPKPTRDTPWRELFSEEELATAIRDYYGAGKEEGLDFDSITITRVGSA